MKGEAIPPKASVAVSVTDAPAQDTASEPRLTKIEMVANRLYELALDLGPGARLPRIQELCTRFDVSITTLTSALDQLTARGVVTRRRGSGIFVSAGVRRANILLLCDAGIFGQLELSPFWNRLIQSARARAQRDALGFELHFVEANNIPSLSGEENTMPVSATVAGLISAGRVDGAITVGVSRETTGYLEANGVPVVAFAGPSAYVVMIDMESLVQQGVKVLAAAGAKRIGLWTPLHINQPRRDTLYFQERWRAGFEDALKAEGLPLYESLIQQNLNLVASDDTIVTKSYQQQGLETGLTVFGKAKSGETILPDAIVSTDDMLTAGMLAAMRNYGIEAGATVREGAICIATHANVGSHMLIGDERRLILLEIDPMKVIDTLFAMLESRIKGEPTPNRIYVPAVLKMPVG